jgi:hypothetical protein
MVDNIMEVSPVKAAILLLISDYKSEEQDTNGAIKKTIITISVLSLDAGAYTFLTFLRKFHCAKEILQWTTGPFDTTADNQGYPNTTAGNQGPSDNQITLSVKELIHTEHCTTSGSLSRKEK